MNKHYNDFLSSFFMSRQESAWLLKFEKCWTRSSDEVRERLDRIFDLYVEDGERVTDYDRMIDRIMQIYQQ